MCQPLRSTLTLPIKALLAILIFCASSWVYALSYFGAEAAVASQSASDRKKATADALEQVLIRVSGVTDLSSVKVLANVKRNPDRFVQQFAYRASEKPEVSDQVLSVSFSPAEIKSLLAQAGLPFWPLNRPSVLVWLAEDNESEGRQIVTDPENLVLSGLAEVANLRGLPLTLPVMDLEDQLSVGPDQVWALDEQAILKASERYDTDTLLIGKYTVTSSGSILSNWQFIHRNVTRSLDYRTQDLGLTGTRSIDALANHLSGLYAVRANTDASGESFLVEVNEIQDYQDFDTMLFYLKNLALVGQLQLNATEEDRVYLNMTLKGSESQLENALALDGRLKWLPAPYRSALVASVPVVLPKTIGLDRESEDVLETPVMERPVQVMPTLRFEWLHKRL